MSTTGRENVEYNSILSQTFLLFADKNKISGKKWKHRNIRTYLAKIFWEYTWSLARQFFFNIYKEFPFFLIFSLNIIIALYFPLFFCILLASQMFVLLCFQSPALMLAKQEWDTLNILKMMNGMKSCNELRQKHLNKLKFL